MAAVGTEAEPLCLVYHAMPWLKALEDRVQAMGAAAGASHHSLVAAMQLLGTVAVQDALALAPKFPNHPVHLLLKTSTLFT